MWHALDSTNDANPIRSIAGTTATSRRASLADECEQDAGASLLFPPQWRNAEEARDALLPLVRRDPHQLGIERSRWTRAHLLACGHGLRLHSRSGLWRLLRRLGIHDQRARSSMHSPDPAYDEKLARIEARQQRVQAHPEEVLLDEDECTLHQQPSGAQAYDQAGSDRPYASPSPRLQLSMRVVATLDAFSGRVLFKRWGKIGTKPLSAFSQLVRASYPTAERIWLIQDNWPLHFHPDVLLGLEPQERLYPVKLPRHWTHEPTQKRGGNGARPACLSRLCSCRLMPPGGIGLKSAGVNSARSACIGIPGRTIRPPGARKSVPSSSNLRLAPLISCRTLASIYPINLSNFIIALMVMGTKMVLHRQVLRLLGPAYEKC
jgi:hypothetical protein